MENPELHLTMLYYMQDLRRQPNQEITPELNDLQEEIGAHFTKGRYIVPLPEEGNGIPLTVQKVKKQPEAPVQKPVSVEAQIDAAIREVQAEAGRE